MRPDLAHGDAPGSSAHARAGFPSCRADRSTDALGACGVNITSGSDITNGFVEAACQQSYELVLNTTCNTGSTIPACCAALGGLNAAGCLAPIVANISAGGDATAM